MRLSVVVVVLLALLSPVSAETLRAGGTGTATNLLPILFAGSERNGAELQVVPNLGSSGGLHALSENALDIAVSGRPLNAAEIKQGLTVAVAVRTPFVLVSSHPKPDELKKTALAAIYSAPRTLWADGSLIRIILRPKSDSDTPILIGQFPGMERALEAARARHDIPTAATDQDSADAAERLAGSLAAATLIQIRSEQRNLRLISIDGVAPSMEAFESGAYPFSKTLYFVLSAQKTPAAKRFVAFIRSPSGQSLLRETGSIMIANPRGS